ncbi:PREDICTED: akirin isoform X2 [Nicrophorus vespilloides]|uniref:Akirin isoform X2 n=1 Tax=Nicrophorus vespilloides TaxID=110193 RepID=A0ABM1NEU4_NICVS|nr:PREDICTED: akirin isoform X2 [Nicrophorus vespilloides]
MACATLKRSLDWEPVLGARPAKRRRCIPFCGTPSPSKERPMVSPIGLHHQSASQSASVTSTPSSSFFPDVVGKNLTPVMAANIRAELKRFQRRKQLQFGSNSDNDSGSGGEQTESPSKSEKPVFTFKQVGLICERMLREKESEIREEYDNVLTTKLAEQYDAFVKFTYDQIQKNYSSVPSYLS